MTRTPRQVGASFRAQRKALDLRQDQVGIGKSTARLIESGQASSEGGAIIRYALALGWPADAWQRLINGDDPETLTATGQPVMTATSALGELLGKPGQLIDDRLTRLEEQMAEILALVDETGDES